MLDARNIYRQVSRAIVDFSPEQQKNIAAIVWLYRGQPERFLSLVESYLAQALAKGQATAGSLLEFEEALGKLTDLMPNLSPTRRVIRTRWRRRGGNSPLRRLSLSSDVEGVLNRGC